MNDLNYNYNLLALSFDTNCLKNFHLETLQTYDFNHAGGVSRGYVNISNLQNFIMDMSDTSIFNECLMNMDYDFLISVEQFHCKTQMTNQIMYDVTSKPAAWHLDYLNVVRDNKYSYIEHVIEEVSVDIWILDTGVNWKHKEFEQTQIIEEDPSFTIQNLTHPHGTGTASAAGGLNYGTSKHFQIHNFPVCKLGGSCANRDIELGLKRVLSHVKDRYEHGHRSVINLSLGTPLGYNPINTTLGMYYNGLFKEISEHGGVVVVAAGNSNQNACNWLYSYSPYVISVGSIDKNYNKSGFSNFGECIDIWAFGSDVPLAYSINDSNVIQYKSGTSFASPIVSGLVANLLYHQPRLTKDEILNILYQKVNGFINPKYNCLQEEIHCCQSTVPGTRLDQHCRNLDLYHCDRACVIAKC